MKKSAPLPPLFAFVWQRMTYVAQENGYALGLHGSLARDCDFIAVAWTEEAVQPPILIEALRIAVGAETWEVGGPTKKPHSRLTWTIHPCGTGPGYYDISVIGPTT